MLLAPYFPLRWRVTSPDNAPGTAGVFPLLQGQQYLVKKAPTWSTILQRAASGRSTAVSLMSAPLWKFEASFEFLRKNLNVDEWSQLVEFFNLQLGQYGLWSYFDPTDNLVANQIFATGDGVTTMFQLKRSVRTWTEPVYVINTLGKVTSNGIAVTNWSRGQYGSITFTAPPANGAVLRWSGSFMFLCRFETDELDLQRILSGHWDAQSLTWTSEKP